MEVTRERAGEGTCVVLELGGRLVGTVTVRPGHRRSASRTYRTEGTWSFGQLAVEPGLQGLGLGDRLLEEVERLARATGATVLACDTAAPARRLVAWYVRRGYREVERVRWDGKTYESLILAKPLAPPLSRLRSERSR